MGGLQGITLQTVILMTFLCVVFPYTTPNTKNQQEVQI